LKALDLRAKRHIHLLLNIWAQGSPRAAELARQARGLLEPAS
jgi:hypothetical protein